MSPAFVSNQLVPNLACIFRSFLVGVFPSPVRIGAFSSQVTKRKPFSVQVQLQFQGRAAALVTKPYLSSTTRCEAGTMQRGSRSCPVRGRVSSNTAHPARCTTACIPSEGNTLGFKGQSSSLVGFGFMTLLLKGAKTTVQVTVFIVGCSNRALKGRSLCVDKPVIVS